jgi:hypothetical protein
LNARVHRLLRPVILYTAFWTLASPLLLAWDRDIALPLLQISTQLLWFLGAYLIVTALTPVLLRAAARPVVATASWAMAAMVIDVLRLLGAPAALGLLNFVAVWALAGQCGLWAFDARHRPRRGSAALIWLGAVLVNAALVGFGPWPVSLVGLPGDRISNMAPPSSVLAIHSIALSAGVVALYPVFARWSHREGVWRLACVVNAAAMTIYLWHLAAMILALAVLGGLGIDLVGYSTQGWLGPRLLFWALFAIFVTGLVWLMRPFEHLPVPWWDSVPHGRGRPGASYRVRAAVGAAGAALTSVGLLALAVTGLVGFPFGATSRYAGFAFTPGLALAVSLGGALLVRWAAVGDTVQSLRENEGVRHA